MATVIFIKESKQTPSAMRGCIRYCVQEKKTVDFDGRQYLALQNMSQSTVISITTGIADLVGDLSAVFNKRPAVEDCTTMSEHRERKKYEYEQSL